MCYFTSRGVSTGDIVMRQKSETLTPKTVQPIVSAESQETALALAASDVLFRMISRYLEILETQVFPKPLQSISHDRKSLKRAEAKLASLTALEALTVIWKESFYVDDNALLLVGMSRTFIEAPMTKHSLSKACCENAGVTDAAKVHSVQSDINRIYSAAELFGLVVRKEKMGNRVPIEGTELLNDIMHCFHGGNALQIHELYQETGPDLNNSGDLA